MCDIWLYFGEGWEKKSENQNKTKKKKKGAKHTSKLVMLGIQYFSRLLT